MVASSSTHDRKEEDAAPPCWPFSFGGACDASFCGPLLVPFCPFLPSSPPSWSDSSSALKASSECRGAPGGEARNDFQRWSANFLLYLPAFIEKKKNSLFVSPPPLWMVTTAVALSDGDSWPTAAILRLEMHSSKRGEGRRRRKRTQTQHGIFSSGSPQPLLLL